MITQRDKDLFYFINKFGQTYHEVLSKTYFPSASSAANRISSLHKQGLISFWNTNLMSPRRAIVLSAGTRKYFEEHLDIKAKKPKIHLSTITHNIIEQISYFWLVKIGRVKKTTVSNDSANLHHVPDFILETQGKKINIEIEITKKTQKRYKDILLDIDKDGVDYILYILKKRDDVKRFAEYLPRSNKLMFIDIDSLIENVKATGKINPIFQEQLLLHDVV
jgi:hypothetical protein